MRIRRLSLGSKAMKAVRYKVVACWVLGEAAATLAVLAAMWLLGEDVEDMMTFALYWVSSGLLTMGITVVVLARKAQGP